MDLEPGSAIPVGALGALQLTEAGTFEFPIDISEPGLHALFTEHHPNEFRAELLANGEAVDPVASRVFKPEHEHDDAVSSVGIDIDGDLDLKRFNRWLQKLLMEQGPDIFRMKGVLSFEDEDRRFVFQGVHMLFDGQPDLAWGNQPRTNKLIFIGRNLDRDTLNKGFASCLAS